MKLKFQPNYLSRQGLVACLGLLYVSLAAATTDEASESFTSTHFSFTAHEVSPPHLWAVKEALESGYAMNLALQKVPSLPQTRITLWSSVREFADAIEDARREGATLTIDPYGYVRQLEDELSIGLLVSDDDAPANAVHQFAHLISTARNPVIATESPWLFESVALYAAKQFRSPAQMSCVTLSDVPNLTSLNEPDNRIILDRVGYLIGEFIVAEFGGDALAKLIDANADLKVLGTTRPLFERSWHRYMSNRYLINNRIPSILSSARINQEIVGNTFYLEDGRYLYLSNDHSVLMKFGEGEQTGYWAIKGGTNVCWKILNFEEFCAVFRMTDNRFFLDTPTDCNRYALRREMGQKKEP